MATVSIYLVGPLLLTFENVKSGQDTDLTAWHCVAASNAVERFELGTQIVTLRKDMILSTVTTL